MPLYSRLDTSALNPTHAARKGTNRHYQWVSTCCKGVLRFLDSSFEISARKSTIGLEILCGVLHFVSSLYVLPVIPIQLEAAGYNRTKSIQVTALGCAIGCIATSYITNLPFVIAPPSSVAIYIAVALQENGMGQSEGDAAVILSGFALLFIGVFKPLVTFATKLIPDCIQASTAIGIGLITALAGAIELKLVVPGRYSILQMGDITAEIVVAFFATMIIAVALYHKIKGPYTMGLLFGTICWWIVANEWPTHLVDIPSFRINMELALNGKVLVFLCSLVFLYILTLSGIARTLSDLAHLTNADGSVPRGNWLFIMCGVSTILSGYFSGPPILISPESAPGIKSGARTGFSMLVCGICYNLSVLFCPLLERVPPAGTSPLLILVGLTLFVNSGRVNWASPDEAVPAFFVLLLIPFTYSILAGVGVGYALYIAIGLATGQLQRKFHRAFLRGPPDEPSEHLGYLSFNTPSNTTYTGDDNDVCGCEAGEGRSTPSTPRTGTPRRKVSFADAVEGDGTVVMMESVLSPIQGVRPRGASFTDQFCMDLESSIKSVQF